MIEVEIPDGTIVEFPDEMSQDDIKSVLQKKFPPPPTFAPSLPQEQIVQKYFGAPPTASVQAPPPLFDESMRQVPMRTTTGTAPTPMMAYDLPPEERRAQFKEDILTPAVPLPRLAIDPKESPLTAAGKEAVNVLIGVPEFVETPAGILSFGAAAIAPILTAGGFTVDMLYNLGKQIKTAYTNWDKMTPAEKTVAVVDMAGTGAFAALTGTAAGRGIQRRLEPPQMKATRELAKVLETTEPMGTVQPRQPIRQLGIPQAALTAEPFLQPGIPELAGQALREAQSPLTVPGRTPAIETLRQELAPPEVVPVEPTRVAERIPGGGEAPYGKVSYMRPAEALTTERTQAAMAEPLPIPPEVQAAVRPQPELERKPDVTQPSETVLRPEPKEATTPAQEVLETGEAKPSTRQLLPEARKKLLKYEEHSANALAKGNELAEKGNETKAEEFYQLSSRWLMRANDLREDAKNYVTQQPTPSAKVEPPPAEPPGAPTAALAKTATVLPPTAKQIPPNSSFIKVVNYDGETTGIVVFPHDGTSAGIKAAHKQAEKYVDENFAWKDEFYNTFSQRGATDASGTLKWVISPNGKMSEVGTPEAAYTLGDINAFRKDALNKAEAAKAKGDVAEANKVIQEQIDKAEASAAEHEKYASQTEAEYNAALKAKESGKKVKELDDRMDTWKQYLQHLKSHVEWQMKNAADYRAEADKWRTQLVKEALPTEAAPKLEEPKTPKATGYTLYEKPDPFSPTGKRYIVAAPDEYGIKLSAKQSGWKVVKKGLTKEEAFSQQEKRNAPLSAEKPSKTAVPEPKRTDIWQVYQEASGEWVATDLKTFYRSTQKSVAEKVAKVKNQDAWLTKLESLKFKEGQEGNLYAFPHPDAIKAIGRSTWNTAIDVAIASIKAGKAIAQAVDDAIAYLRKNVKGLDETQARANLEYVAREETKPTVQIPSTEGETIKMRKSAEHATTSPMVPEPVQERITKAPESFYPQQSVPRVKDVVEDMSDANLAAMPKDSNLYVAARLKLIDRLFQRGDLNAGYNVFVELEKGGTTMGQLINQFKLLKGSRPENVVRLLNEKLKREGKDVLNPEQQQRALEKVVTSKQKDAALDKATNDWRKEPSLENAEAAEKALLDANAAAVDLQRFVSRFSPRSTASILKSILQGGLLTPISEVANIVGNMSFLPFRAGDRTIASFLDVLDNHLLGTKRQITVQPVRGTAEAVKGFGRGASQIPEIFRRGTGDVIKGETRAGLHPIQAWINQFVSNPEMPTTGGKLTLNDRLNLFLEGTLGVPTEAMLRGLGAGDIAFREAAKGRATATELALSKVPKDQWSFAQKFPELFLDEAALDRINTQTTQAVFQRPSKTLNVIVNRIRGIGEWFDLLTATIAPYKLTPWNIVGEILSYNPLVAFTRSLNDIRTGNRLAAKLNTGKYIVGSALATAGWWLYSKGLMSPSLDQRDEQTKARVLAGEIMPPNHINISGLNRSMDKFAKLQKPTLEDTAFRSGDETVDVFRAGGLAGSMFYMMANIGRDFERKPEVANSEIWQSILTQSTLEQARFGMNQSFLSGVEGLLSAVREGNTDNFVRQWGNTVASIPFPNTLTVLSRATREFKPDFREDTFRKQMENVIRNKLGFAGLDDYLPLQRGLWGEPIRETPEGRNSILYHFFDVTKNRQVTSDPGKIELFRLWRKTADSRIIPSIPERQITVQSKNYPLNGEQYSRYAELVGKERKRIFDAIVVNPQFHKLSDEAKVAGLDRIYRAGLDAGKAKFWKERGATLIPKPPRAGFAPAP